MEALLTVAQEIPDHPPQRLDLEQKRVVAVARLDLAVRHRHLVAHQRGGQPLRLDAREEPVARERDDQERRLDRLEGLDEVARRMGGDVEVVGCAGDVEVTVGVEALDEALALMFEVALDREVVVEVEVVGVLVLQVAPELAAHRLFGKIGDVREHPRRAQPPRRRSVGLVVAVAERRVGLDRLAGDPVEGDVLRRELPGGGDRDHAVHRVGIGDRPFEHLHPAHRPADDREQFLYSEPVDQRLLGAHHVAHGDDGEVQIVGFPGIGVDRTRTGRAGTAADDVRADHEVLVGVDVLARTDHRIPPAGFAVFGSVLAADVGVAREGMGDQHGVGAFGIERARRFVADIDLLEFAAAVERQNARDLEILRRDDQRSFCDFLGDFGFLVNFAFGLPNYILII